MTRTACTICERPDVDTINAALSDGKSYRAVASRFALSRDNVSRHAGHVARHPTVEEIVETMPETTPPATTSQPHETPIQPGASWHNGRFENPPATPEEATAPVVVDLVDAKREEIVAYIQSRLGPALAAVYSEAIRLSVSIGQYDSEWSQGAPYVRIEKYLSALLSDWLSKRANGSDLSARLFYLLDFGTPEQKAMLAQLGLMDTPVVD